MLEWSPQRRPWPSISLPVNQPDPCAGKVVSPMSVLSDGEKACCSLIVRVLYTPKQLTSQTHDSTKPTPSLYVDVDQGAACKTAREKKKKQKKKKKQRWKGREAEEKEKATRETQKKNSTMRAQGERLCKG
ncbi:uncharacterized protein ARB_04632 [Trichophyton benhamiae CBS 112371]|uniref:Uncharacterized protein n=1 Tax=Arthroderma benhamiae (strain ATCC MYA-4681 / CBS 112371) TaxID=663331 RepID=D4AK31_ARTBC|nr:uncharacterized protein ARB_04632 [Trichophyton benhamiae CBS 112371]EFE37104.1 hypothetical protein ARB_04632 [Trichophyton benhamiae CBS 112371]